MKVLLINGSPHEKGCTYTALKEVADSLEKNGVETEIFWIGNKPIGGCIGCGGCFRSEDGCVFGKEDGVNACIEKLKAADGVVVGSPVHYASAGGNICAFLDRVFFAKSDFSGKLGAAVVSCRRGGASASFDRLNKYFTISGMPVVSRPATAATALYTSYPARMLASTVCSTPLMRRPSVQLFSRRFSMRVQAMSGV